MTKSNRRKQRDVKAPTCRCGNCRFTSRGRWIYRNPLTGIEHTLEVRMYCPTCEAQLDFCGETHGGKVAA